MSERLQESANEERAATDVTPEQAAERRYLEALDGLVVDACDCRQMHTLADSLAWTAARIVSGYGVGAAGDILRRLGQYIGEIETRRRAEDEAEQARKEGRRTH